jgi:hypothetical protein
MVNCTMTCGFGLTSCVQLDNSLTAGYAMVHDSNFVVSGTASSIGSFLYFTQTVDDIPFALIERNTLNMGTQAVPADLILDLPFSNNTDYDNRRNVVRSNTFLRLISTNNVQLNLPAESLGAFQSNNFAETVSGGGKANIGLLASTAGQQYIFGPNRYAYPCASRWTTAATPAPTVLELTTCANAACSTTMPQTCTQLCGGVACP